jgi:uncharacterized protein
VSCRISSFVVAALALVSACSSSPPTRFYTLSDTAPDAHPAPAPGAGSVRVDRVTIPGELDRPQIVRQLDANRLQFAELERWAAPLDEMIRRVLTTDVARRLPAQSAGNPGAGRQRSLSVDIGEFYGDASCNVTLRAVWTPKQPHPEAAQATTEEVHVPSTGACPDSLPATMSVALGQLSDRIVAGVARSNVASGNP